MSAPRDRLNRATRLVQQGSITAERACAGKSVYPTKNEARSVAKVMAKKKERIVDSYKCPFCPYFHLTVRSHGAESDDA